MAEAPEYLIVRRAPILRWLNLSGAHADDPRETCRLAARPACLPEVLRTTIALTRDGDFGLRPARVPRTA